jgi:serine protease Do
MNEPERYTYAIQRPVPTQTPKAKRHYGPLIALIVVALLFSAGIGGVSGIFAYRVFTAPPAVTDTLDNSSGIPSFPPSVSTVPDTPSYAPVTGENKDLTPAEVYEKSHEAVVAINSTIAGSNQYGQPSTYTGSGSGFFISEDGYIVTNHHVIDSAKTIEVILYDGSTIPAKLIGSDSTADLAVLKVEGKGYSFLNFGDNNLMRVGDVVCAIGNPMGDLPNTQTVGSLSAMSREITVEGVRMTVLQTDAAVSPGNSGGPLINSKGEVIGIVSAKSVDESVEGIGFAIPANIAKPYIEDLKEHGKIQGRPYLGISVDQNYSAYAQRYGLKPGAYVASVEPGSCAAKAGLQEGDVITSVGEYEVNSYETLVSAKNQFKAGETTEFTYVRDSKDYKGTITFDSVPAQD